MNTSAINDNRVKDFSLSPEDFLSPSFSDVDLFIEYALDKILSAVKASTGSFYLWDEFSKEFILHAVRGLKRERLGNGRVKLREGILGWVANEGQPILVKDIQEDRRFPFYKRDRKYRSDSFISLPLVSQNKLLGVINITERENSLPFSEEDFFCASAFAAMIAIAYENLRLAGRMKKENADLFQSNGELKDQQKKNESLLSMGKLATHLAHELNHPLDVIRRYVNLALEQSLEDSLAREYLVKAKKGICRAISVIRDLLRFSKESHKAASRLIEVRRLIDESLSAVQEDPGFQQIKIRKILCETQRFVKDYGLALVLHNLYQNARQAMAGQGELTVMTDVQNGNVRIVVEDTGCGVPEAIRSSIFDPFFSTKTQGKGIGLGLAICREILGQSNGKITCENLPERGASFMITLPCHHESNP